MPLVEHPRSGVYFDPCAPHYRLRLSHAVAILAGLLLWLVLIFMAVAVYRYVRGGA